MTFAIPRILPRRPKPLDPYREQRELLALLMNAVQGVSCYDADDREISRLTPAGLDILIAHHLKIF